MKTAGIIAEYQPFHNGHRYQIEKARKKTGADFIIAVMSGDFVQRGAPALLEKYCRACMALENGVDLVLELPVRYATSSAEGFAFGGVSILNGLGVVNDLCFGVETCSDTDLDVLNAIASLLAAEPEGYRLALRDELRTGISFPSARERALLCCLARETSPLSSLTPSMLHSLLSMPNHILAIEYMKAIKHLSSAIRPCPITRIGAARESNRMSAPYSSAAAIRGKLFFLQSEILSALPKGANPVDAHPGSDSFSEGGEIFDAVPPGVCSALEAAVSGGQCLSPDDFSDMLCCALHASLKHPFPAYDIPSLAEHICPSAGAASCKDSYTALRNRTERLLEHYMSWTQFTGILKSKDRTYTSLSRYLTRILLGLPCEQYSGDHAAAADAAASFHSPYARILGFRKSCAPLIRKIRDKSLIPVLTQPAKELSLLDDEQRLMLEEDTRACDLYRQVLFSKSGVWLPHDFRRTPIIL